MYRNCIKFIKPINDTKLLILPTVVLVPDTVQMNQSSSPKIPNFQSQDEAKANWKCGENEGYSSPHLATLCT